MVNILVTGGAGFIGSSLVNQLIKNKHYKIVVLDNLVTGKIKNVDKNINYIIKKDVNNYNELKNIFIKHKFDYVFHFAALVGVKRTQLYPLKVLNDIKGFQNIFELSSNYNVKRFFYSSSSEVYGEPVIIPQNEETSSNFSAFTQSMEVPLEKEIQPDPAALKQLAKFTGQGGGISLSFERKLMGDRVFYDPATDTLTIRGIPPNLKDQLNRQSSMD